MFETALVYGRGARLSTRRGVPTFSFSYPSEMPSQGNLTKVPAYALLLWAEQKNITSSFVFQKGTQQKKIWIDEGKVVAIESNLLAEGFGYFLRRRFFPELETKIALERFESLCSEMEWSPDFLQDFESNPYLSHLNVSEVIQRFHLERLLNLLGWFHGTYQIQEEGLKREPTPNLLSLRDTFSHVEKWLLGISPSIHPLLKKSPDQLAILSQDGAALLFHQLSITQAKGTLSLDRRDKRKMIHWNNGAITSVASTDPIETLAAVLIRWNYLPAEIVHELESRARTQGDRFRDAIRKEEYLDEPLLLEALQILHFERILECLSWRQGQIEFQGKRSPESPQKLEIKAEIYESQKEKLQDRDEESEGSSEDQELEGEFYVFLGSLNEFKSLRHSAQILHLAKDRLLFFFQESSDELPPIEDDFWKEIQTRTRGLPWVDLPSSVLRSPNWREGLKMCLPPTKKPLVFLLATEDYFHLTDQDQRSFPVTFLLSEANLDRKEIQNLSKYMQSHSIRNLGYYIVRFSKSADRPHLQA